MSFSIPLKSPGTVAPKMEAQLEAKDSSGDEMPNAEEPELPPRHRSLSPELPPGQQGASPELASLGVEHEKETKLAIGSGAPSRRRIRLEAEIFRALNLARTNPLQMAEELVKLSIQMNDEKHLVFDWGVVDQGDLCAVYSRGGPPPKLRSSARGSGHSAVQARVS